MPKHDKKIEGFEGLLFITGAVILVSILISTVVGIYSHWVPMVGGLIVGWMAVDSINR